MIQAQGDIKQQLSIIWHQPGLVNLPIIIIGLDLERCSGYRLVHQTVLTCIVLMMASDIIKGSIAVVVTMTMLFMAFMTKDIDNSNEHLVVVVMGDDGVSQYQDTSQQDHEYGNASLHLQHRKGTHLFLIKRIFAT